MESTWKAQPDEEPERKITKHYLTRRHETRRRGASSLGMPESVVSGKSTETVECAARAARTLLRPQGDFLERKATVCKVRIAIAGTAIRQSSETNRKMPAKFILQRNFSVWIKAILTAFFLKKGTKNGGVNRNRTDLSDFADRCLTSWLSRLVTML